MQFPLHVLHAERGIWAGFPFSAASRLLTFEEITRLARLFVARGVEKIRLTGGEPLLRRNIEELIAMLHGIDGLRI